MTTMAHTWKPSDAQVNLLKTIFTERVPADEANRDQFWRNLTQGISNRESFQTAIDALKARPMVRPVYVPPVPQPNRTDIATEAGLYRDPSDGTLYKLGKRANSWDTPSLSVYSLKATVRRLTPEGQMVRKGTWTKLTAYEVRQRLAVSPRVHGPRLLAEWLMGDEDKQTWAVGFCLLCSKPLIDAISVYNACGPICATKYGVARVIPSEEVQREIEKNVLSS